MGISSLIIFIFFLVKNLILLSTFFLYASKKESQELINVSKCDKPSKKKVNAINTYNLISSFLFLFFYTVFKTELIQ